MNKDIISDMTPDQIDKTCLEILGYKDDYLPPSWLIGKIIEKLQEWDHVFRWNCDGWVVGGSCYHETSLPRAFLKAAIILGHWSPPKKVEEPKYWRHKDTGTVWVEPFIGSTEDMERVTVTPYKEGEK